MLKNLHMHKFMQSFPQTDKTSISSAHRLCCPVDLLVKQKVQGTDRLKIQVFLSIPIVLV